MSIGFLLIVVGIALAVLSRQAKQPTLLRTALGVMGVGLVVSVMSSAFIVIPAGQVGVVFSALNGIKPNSLEAGYHFRMPGIETVTLYDTRLQELTLSRLGEDGPNIDESIHARSKEGLEISIDVTTQFRIKSDQVSKIHRELGPNYLNTVIRPQIRSKVRDGVGQFTASDLISTKRSELERRIVNDLNSVFDKNNLELITVLLREIRIPASLAKVIEEKQTAEQMVQIENNRLQQSKIAAQRKIAEAQGESTAAIARAEGEAKALSLRGKALKENPEIIQLTVAEKLSPTIQTVILPSEGNFLLNMDSLLKKK